VARMGGRRGAGFLVGEHDGKRPLGRPCADGRIILKWTFKKWDLEALCGLFWLRIGTVGELL